MYTVLTYTQYFVQIITLKIAQYNFYNKIFTIGQIRPSLVVAKGFVLRTALRHLQQNIFC